MPTNTPIPAPTIPKPTPIPVTICGNTQELPGFGNVLEGIGYALVPTYLPEGFQTSGADINRGRARHIYGNAQNRLVIAYPVEYFPEGNPVMQTIGLFRPDDAVSEIDLNGQVAYLMRGGWSDATILAGPGIPPEQAEWDYDKSLTLFFDCQIPQIGSVGIAIQALNNAPEWLSGTEMIKIALSLAQVTEPEQSDSG